jgi:hypothetical protein
LARYEFLLAQRLAEKRRQATTFALLERAQAMSDKAPAASSRFKKEGIK